MTTKTTAPNVTVEQYAPVTDGLPFAVYCDGSGSRKVVTRASTREDAERAAATHREAHRAS